MGKFKEMAIDIEEMAALQDEIEELEDEIIKKIEDHIGPEKPEDCNCDQALSLKEALQVAINHGVNADDYIDSLQFIVTSMATLLLNNNIMTDSELEETFGIVREKIVKQEHPPKGYH